MVRYSSIQKPAAGAPETEPLQIQVAANGGEFSYQFLHADGKYFVRRSDREQFFELSRYDYECIADLAGRNWYGSQRQRGSHSRQRREAGRMRRPPRADFRE